jgi:ABC-type amino acid transport substrate-binding protein
MAHEVFISYCSEDKAVADAVCAGLEGGRVRCWIAPRDVAPGANWGRSIVHAITASKVMVVIFSGHTNRSRHVMNEIERAVSHGVTILPFRIEDVAPSEDLELFISSCHWLDALTPPIEAKIAELVRAVRRVLGHETVDEAAGVQAPVVTPPLPAKTSMRNRLLAGLGLLALLGLAAVWLAPAGKRGDVPAGPTVGLVSPPDGAVRLGPTLLEWNAPGLDKKNLEFELCITGEDGIPSNRRFSRNTHPLRGVSGKLRWKVRPVWAGEGDAGRLGVWSTERDLTYYPDALDRILATRTIHVGTAESGNIFVLKEDGEFTGFDIELLRRVGNAILRAHGIEGHVRIDYTHCVWGEELFRMLGENPAVDLLASGISITPERERTYRLVFSRPILEYPQTLVTRKGHRIFEDGRFVVGTVAAAANTTNETLAKQLAGTAGVEAVPYEGSGTYDRMLADLLAGKIDGVLMDKPYVLERIAAMSPDGNPPVDTTDMLPGLVPNLELEKIGFAFRISDSRLTAEINKHLEELDAEKPALIRRFFARPEAFLPAEQPMMPNF